MAVKLVTDTDALTTTAVGDLFFLADVSDSNTIKEITIQNLLQAPADNAVTLGGASNGFTAVNLTDGTARAAVDFTSNIARLHPVTDDGSDDYAVGLAGGGTFGQTRGAQLLVYGNENASTGQVYLQGGAVATAHVIIRSYHDDADIYLGGGTSGTTRWIMNGDNGDIIPQQLCDIGADSTTTAVETLGMSDGTAKATVVVTGNALYIQTGTDHDFFLRRNGAQAIKLIKTTDGDTVPAISVGDSAPADANLGNSELVFWLDEGSNKLMATWKESGGTALDLDLGAGS